MRYLTVVTLLAAALVFAKPAGADPTYWPGYKQCDTFELVEYNVEVYKKRVKCSFARRIVKSYYIDGDGWRYHDRGPAMSYYTNRRKFKGWKCSSGSGGGGCYRGRKKVGYETVSN